jgi:hypothetical protein
MRRTRADGGAGAIGCFTKCDDGVIRPLMAVVPEGIPATLQLLINAVSAIRGQTVSKPLRTLRSMLPRFNGGNTYSSLVLPAGSRIADIEPLDLGMRGSAP